MFRKITVAVKTDNKCDISVVIPLYNKEREIGDTISSVLAQTMLPREIIVVDDGSTDLSAEVVKTFRSPLIKLISQPNSGVSAARNRGAVEAAGKFIALLDGDDTWEPGFISSMHRLIDTYPGCGVYASGFSTVRNGRKFPANNPPREEVFSNFFCDAMAYYICTCSSVVVSRDAYFEAGGFPEGMKLGEDLYFWIKLASLHKVCFTPERLANYIVTSSNRSQKGYTPETTEYSFRQLYKPEEGNSCRNEYIARCALGKALALSAKGDTVYGRETARFFAYTILNRRALRKLRILNRTPRFMRPFLHRAYNRLAWMIARKGFE